MSKINPSRRSQTHSKLSGRSEKKVKAKVLTDEEKLSLDLRRWNGDIDLYRSEMYGIKHVWRKRGDLDHLKPGDKAIWTLQDEFLKACPRAIAEKKPIIIASGHSCGKDYIVPIGELWFLDTFIPSVVIQSAPTARQVKDIMWKETRSHWDNRKVDLGGKAYTEPRIEIDPDWYLVGFTTKETTGSKEAGGAKFQGFKGKSNICIVLTEAQAIDDLIFDQVDAVISGATNVLVIMLGNPTRSKGRFAKYLRDTKNNIVFHFSCLETPNYVERREVIPGLASYEWVEKRRLKWGEDDVRWVARVLGQIPAGGLDQVFSDATIEHAKSRYGFIAQHSFNRGVVWDPAGDGMDPHVLLAGSNGEVMEVFEKTLMSPKEGAIQAVEMCHKIKASWILVDCDGVGQRDFAALKELPRDYIGDIQLIPFHGSAPSTKFSIIIAGGKEVHKPMYKNLRTEAAFVAKDRITSGRASINPKDEEMIEDLQEDSVIEDKDPLQIIDKDDIRENLQRSPGRGDCYKMFQWACEQKFKEIVYTRGQSNVPYGNMSDPISGYQFKGGPAYGAKE